MNKALYNLFNAETQALVLRAIVGEGCRQAMKTITEDSPERAYYRLTFVQGFLAAHEWYTYEMDISDAILANLAMLERDEQS